MRRTSFKAPTRLLALALVLSLTLLPSSALASGPPSVTASGAVMDSDTGEIYYDKNADVPRPSASMSKIMSIYLVFEAMEAGQLTPDTPIPISAKAAAMSRNGAYSGLEKLPYGGTCTVDTLLRLIMTYSCCASVVALAEYVAGSEEAFVERMNAKAEEWGIAAHYADCTGWIDSGNAVSPRAMAEITRRMIHDYPIILDYSALHRTTYQGQTFTSTNRMLRDGSYPGIDGLKTGTTNGAGYCFTGTAIRDGRRIITVVMNSSSTDTRVSDTRKLLDYGFSVRRDLTFSGSLGFGYVAIRPGNSISVPVNARCDQEISCTVPSGWYLDGEPIKGYSNAEFAFAPDGNSAYIFRATEDMEPGPHVLSFRCNIDGLPGITPAEFGMVLDVLP